MTMNARRATFYGVENEFVLDSLIRILLTKLLLPCNGFLLHAATVVHGGEAYVFMGRSGAGKSTVASLSPPGSALTDEISLLRRDEGRWRAYGTPFWGEFRAEGQNHSVPVGAVYSLVQARQNYKQRLPGNASLTSMLANTLFFLPGRAGREALLGILAGFVKEVPVYRLEFRKDATFWEVAA